MKKLNLEIEKLNKEEMSTIEGGWGTMPYANYTYRAGGNNSLIYAAEAAANGIKFGYNGVASAWNWGYRKMN